MAEKTVRVLCPNGIHISPAGVMAKLLKKVSARAEILRGGDRADAGDVDAVLALALREGEDVTVRALGDEADTALSLVEAVLREGTKMLATWGRKAAAAPAAGSSAPEHAAPMLSSRVRIGQIRQVADDFDKLLSFYEKGSPMEEAGRFGEAVKVFAARMEAAARASARSGDTRQQFILEGYRMMAEAQGFHAEVGRAIADGASAPEAVLAAKERLAEAMLLQERAGDQREVGRSLARILLGEKEIMEATDGTPLILVGDEISPELMARFPGDRLSGIAQSGGSPSGHAAILARMRGIPCLLGYTDAAALPDGATAIIDGEKGTVVVHPSEAELRAARQRIEEEQSEARRLLEETGPAVTKDGTGIALRANVGAPEEAEAAMRGGAEGVGLFRSEFLFLGRDELPSEDEQAAAYGRAAKACGGAPCVIRTLDAGGDKEIPALHLPKEANPFLGFRAIRISLSRPELLSAQLRAVLRAAKEGKAMLLLPMVVSVSEVDAVREALARERRALFGEGGDAPEVPVGVMIETPAAVMQAEALAKCADFFSIGTNDLAQYTLAADRTNASLSYLDAMFHPAVLRMIRMAADAASGAGIPVEVCGEMAADPLAVPLLLGLGVTALSMAAPMLPRIRAVVRGTSLSGARLLAEDALRQTGPAAVRALAAQQKT
ncbi:MAG: phosphoenolpyruvate--protein phosphotransferase [Schwartzia sp.]|nr:phosphoenolpyruvate--protein phosphotransferase [Schwartzia sp. (in: firmicutes)]